MSLAMLPSSFSMNMTSLIMAKWFQQRYHAALLLMGIMAIVGWPFALVAHLIPFLVTVRCVMFKGREELGRQRGDDTGQGLSTQWPLQFWQRAGSPRDASASANRTSPITFHYSTELNVPFRWREIVIAVVLLVSYILVSQSYIPMPTFSRANLDASPYQSMWIMSIMAE